MKRLRARNQNGWLAETASGEYQANWTEYVISMETGKPKRKHRSQVLGKIGNGKNGTLRKCDAEKMLQKLVEPINAATYAKQDSRVTFQWFTENKFLPLWSGRWSRASEDHYRQYLRLYMYPVLGAIALEDINATIVQSWLNGMAKRNLSKWVILKAKALAKTILEFATDVEHGGFIVRNPMRSQFVVMPRCRASKKPVISMEQLQALWSAIDEQWVHLAIVTGTICAVRASELFGLVWECVEPTRLLIRSSAYNGKLSEWRVKRDASFRYVPINEQLYRDFQRWKKMTDYVAAQDLVFGNDSGEPRWSGSFLQKRVQPIARKVGITIPVTFQVLRRTFITENQNELKALQGVAGHASISQTGDGYAQPITETQSALVDSYYWKIMNAAKPEKRVQ